MPHALRRTRKAALAVILGLTLVGTLAVPAGAARTVDDACPDDAPDEFVDDETSVHESNINCIAYWGVTEGKTATRYEPDQGVRRDQMASFILREMEVAGYVFPDNAPDAFEDDDTSVHEENINLLAEEGIVEGTGGRQYDPEVIVTRDRMASFIVRMLEAVTGDALQPQEDHFPDDEGNFHEDNINILADLDIVEGKPDGDYDPEEQVSRASMASFLARAADYLAEQGFWPPLEGDAGTIAVNLFTSSVAPGEDIVGEITGDTANLDEVQVTGECIPDTTITPADDTDADQEGIQFEIPTSASAPAGECVLTFEATFEDGSTQTLTETVTIEAATTSTTEGPDLQSCTTTAVTTTSATVRYLFDEPLVGAARTSGFVLYGPDTRQQRYPASEATINGSEVDAVFQRNQFDESVVCAVEAGAVEDSSGVGNPEGSDALEASSGGSARRASFPAGITSAPDLQSIGNVRDVVVDSDATTTGNQTEFTIDFVFDETAYVVDPAGFQVVTSSGRVVPCTGADSDPPSNTVTATCTAAAGDFTFGAGDDTAAEQATAVRNQIARGAVLRATVSDAEQDAMASGTEGNANAQQTTDGTTSRPDLSSVTLDKATDTVIFTFDTSVQVTGGPTAFQVYYRDATEEDCRQVSMVSGSTTQVRCTFLDSNNRSAVDINNFVVGASVDTAAVTGTGTGGQPNAVDEEGIAQNDVLPAGETFGPELVSVTRDATPETGTPTDVRFTFVFNAPVDDSVADFVIYEADGTRYELQTCHAGDPADEEDENKVYCDVGEANDENALGLPSFVSDLDREGDEETVDSAEEVDIAQRAVLAAAEYDAAVTQSSPQGASDMGGTDDEAGLFPNVEMNRRITNV